jgi:hypothetical protein
VWSLGATTYHALAGGPPYDVGENLLGALYRIVHEEPPRLGAAAGWLAPVLLATMTQRTEDRWSMAHVRDFLAGGPSAPLPAPLPREIAVGVPSSPEPDPTSTQVITAVPPVPPAPAAAAPPAPRPRRRGVALPVLVLAILVALVVIVVAWVLGNDDDPGADPETPSSSTSGPASEPPASTEDVTADGMENFVEDYLATVTSDPKAAWERLTPQFQEQSGNFGQYQKFWSGYQSADIIGLQADPAAMTVTYQVEYVDNDGQKTTDRVTLGLEGTDGNFLIADES